jgi:hypothetical protein
MINWCASQSETPSPTITPRVTTTSIRSAAEPSCAAADTPGNTRGQNPSVDKRAPWTTIGTDPRLLIHRGRHAHASTPSYSLARGRNAFPKITARGRRFIRALEVEVVVLEAPRPRTQTLPLMQGASSSWEPNERCPAVRILSLNASPAGHRERQHLRRSTGGTALRDEHKHGYRELSSGPGGTCGTYPPADR